MFLVSVPVGLFATVWAYRKLEEPGEPRPARIDWWGNVTFAAGLVALMVGITYGIRLTAATPWAGPARSSSTELVGGLVAARGLRRHRARVADPMFHLDVRIRAFTAGNVATCSRPSAAAACSSS